MKSKKLLGFVSAIMGICLSVTSFVGLTAFAEETNIEYTVKGGTVKECIFVENSLADYFETTEGEAIDVKKIKSVMVIHDTLAELENGTHYDFDKNKGTILFGREGLHDVVVTFEADVATDPLTKKVEVVTKDQVKPVEYVIDDAKIEAFNDAMQTAVNAISEDATSVAIDDSFWNYVSSEVFDKSHFRTKVYVQTPGTESANFSVVSSSWGSTLSKINLTNKGTYYFYVEVKDACYNTIVKSSDYKLKANGWYEKTQEDDPSTPDVDETEYNKLVIPVFEFEFNRTPVHKVEIETKVKEGIVGQEYAYVKVNPTSSEDTTVKLYYNPSVAIDKKPNEEGATGWVEVVNGTQAEVASLTETSVRFTPLEKGAFCVYVESVGGEDGFDKKEAYSEIIVVNREIQQQKLVNDGFAKFLKNNWLSVVFLGIALLCIVGIIILAFYNPKDATPAPKKKEKVEDEEVKEENEDEVVDVAEEDEEVEEVEEETTEVEETEEATDAPAEETDVPAEDTETPAEVPAEETTAPVEDAPAEEKPEGENA